MPVLTRAVEKGQSDILRLLLEHGADPERNPGNRSSGPALRVALDRERPEILRMLVERGASLEARDEYGRTLLHHAVSSFRLDKVKWCLDCGADVNARDEHDGTALHKAAGLGLLDALALLVERGADVNAQSRSGRTPLHTCAVNRQSHAAYSLLDEGADPSIRDSEGKTAFAVAQDEGSAQIARLLYPRNLRLRRWPWSALRRLLGRGEAPFEPVPSAGVPDGSEPPPRRATSILAGDLLCAYCRKPNAATRWPVAGDDVPFYYQREPGDYSVEVRCWECDNTWFVVWDDDPGPVRPL